MTTNDLGFDKDLAKPRLALKRVRSMLSDPLGLTAMADRILHASESDDSAACWDLMRDLLELEGSLKEAGAVRGCVDFEGHELDSSLCSVVTNMYDKLEMAGEMVGGAFQNISTDDMAYVAASLLGGVFNVEDHDSVRQPLANIGVPQAAIRRSIRDDMALDPAPSVTRYLDILERIDVNGLIAGGGVIAQALNECALNIASNTVWPRKATYLSSPLGDICIGSPGDDRHTRGALLIIEPGGDDTYSAEAGSANGLAGRRLSVILDLDGHDRYLGDGILAPGAALFGVSIVFDACGNDVCQAAYAGQGVGLCGLGWLEDKGGDDVYRAHGLAQAAAYVGAGLLRDCGGHDVYEVGFYGQGFAGVRGVGLLIDRDGNDRYLAGGRKPDHERHDERYLSLAQGFAIGIRPFAGGGVAALIDLAGNDVYEADVYGQGVSYWYSAGFLLDRSGHDSYRVYHYGQGSGIHLSLGLLADGAGDDSYTGYSLVQGNSHDFGVGMLFDHSGNDVYTADNCSQGRGMNNALGLLMDSAGNDAYFACDNTLSQGIGGRGREYGSIALLLDLAGTDCFSCGATDGARLLRPDYGIVYDLKAKD